VNDPILLFLTLDVIALLIAGAMAAVMPAMVCGFLTTTLCGLGTLLCLPSLLLRIPATALDIPLGPPGLSLHFALDTLSVFFLFIALLAATATAAIQAATISPTRPASPRVTAFCVAGTGLSLLAADGVALTIGLTVACAALWDPEWQAPPRPSAPAHRDASGIPFSGTVSPLAPPSPAAPLTAPIPRTGPLAVPVARISILPRPAPVMLLAPILLLASICLLTPAGYAPRFDAIRAAPIDPDHAAAAAILALAAVAALAWPRPNPRCAIRDTLTACMLIPTGSYLLLRVIADLCGAAPQAWWGFLLLLAGGFAAVVEGWRSAATPEIDTAIAALMRRQAGLATACIGLALVARAADLAGSATFALQATCLTAIGASLAGAVTSLAAHAIGAGAGSFRLSRLGGLIHTMPATSAALAAGLLTLSALPFGLGFAALWLAFQSILSAPRTGGLLSQLPLALIAAAIALSAAIATAASVRLIGIAILGRPRTPRGAGATEPQSAARTILLTLAAASLLAGLFPNPLLWVLANPAILAVTGLPPSRPTDLTILSVSGASAPYLVLPVFAVLALATGAVALTRRQSRSQAKTVGPWTDGLQPPVGLPFGEPAAQSAGAGFLPALPHIAWPHRRTLERPTADWPTLDRPILIQPTVIRPTRGLTKPGVTNLSVTNLVLATLALLFSRGQTAASAAQPDRVSTAEAPPSTLWPGPAPRPTDDLSTRPATGEAPTRQTVTPRRDTPHCTAAPPQPPSTTVAALWLVLAAFAALLLALAISA
jgi:hydrogenase-4 component B